MSEENYPSVDYPTILEGKIWGGPIRCETLGGLDMYLDHPDQVTVFKNFKPFEKDGKTWAITHLQKKTKKGWIKTSPDCFHCWYTIKPQQQDAQENWIPGSEKVLYFRKPFSWRWDPVGTVINGILRHWIWTKGYFNLSLHWD